MTDTADDVREWAQLNPAQFGQLIDQLGFRYSNRQMFERVTAKAESDRRELQVEYALNRRDQFAMAALTGLIAASETSDNWSWRTGSLAGDAYLFADEMLEARKVVG